MAFPCFILLGALRVLYWQILALRYGAASKYWPSVIGVIVYSGIARYGGNSYRAEANYEYVIEGATHRCKRMQFGLTLNIPKRHALQFVSRLPIGAEVRVYYNADNPKVATLFTGISAGNLIVGWLFSIGPILAGLWGLGTIS